MRMRRGVSSPWSMSFTTAASSWSSPPPRLPRSSIAASGWCSSSSAPRAASPRCRARSTSHANTAPRQEHDAPLPSFPPLGLRPLELLGEALLRDPHGGFQLLRMERYPELLDHPAQHRELAATSSPGGARLQAAQRRGERANARCQLLVAPHLRR